jgi:hypothetical protein
VKFSFRKNKKLSILALREQLNCSVDMIDEDSDNFILEIDGDLHAVQEALDHHNPEHTDDEFIAKKKEDIRERELLLRLFRAFKPQALEQVLKPAALAKLQELKDGS